MPPISFDLNLALIAGRAVFLVFCFVLAAIAFTRWRRAADRSTDQFAAQTERVLGRLAEIEARMEGTLTQLSERVAVLNTATAGNTTSPSYQIAIRMARSGLAREELMSSCGLTRQEADLVQRLHAPVQQLRVATVG